MTRREALSFALGTIAWSALPVALRAKTGKRQAPEDFARMVTLIRQEKLRAQPIGAAIVAIGRAFLGTPYEGATLEINANEQCVINFKGLDCVTFFELSLDLARIALKDTLSYEALVKEVTFTRYRDGKLTDYTSRLHYTTDWFSNNVKKRVVENITRSLGGVPFVKTIDFMSTHPDKYRQLNANPALLPAIRAAEERLAHEEILYVPKDRVAAIEEKLQDGDIIGITTTIPGIDCSHTGLIVRDGAHARFLHASSIKKQVIIADGSLADYLAGVSKHTGIIVVRPLPPR